MAAALPDAGEKSRCNAACLQLATFLAARTKAQGSGFVQAIIDDKRSVMVVVIAMVVVAVIVVATTIVVIAIVLEMVVVAIVIAVPCVIVVHSSARTVPVALIEHSAVATWRHPVSAIIRRTGPIPGMPSIMAIAIGIRIPISAHPNEPRSGSRWSVFHSDCRCRTDSYSKRYLGACDRCAAQEQRTSQQRSCQKISHCGFTSESGCQTLFRLGRCGQNDDTRNRLFAPVGSRNSG